MTEKIFYILMLILWGANGILALISQRMKIEIEYSQFWMCYIPLMTYIIRDFVSIL